MARFISSHLTCVWPLHLNINLCSCARGYASEAMRSLGSDGSMASMAAQRMKSIAAQGEEKIKKRVFWMRDPATGDWIPEDHFDDIDAADLREKLLCRK